MHDETVNSALLFARARRTPRIISQALCRTKTHVAHIFFGPTIGVFKANDDTLTNCAKPCWTWVTAHRHDARHACAELV